MNQAPADAAVAAASDESYTCVQDPSRSCGGCSASTGPADCPYLYLIDEARG